MKIAININGCWEWTGFKFPKGYGQFSLTINGDRYAHRISYFLFKNVNPDKLAVCHTCDNPSCVNPNHMFLGTLNDNNQDMIRKGRSKKGKHYVTHCKNGHEYIEGNITYTKSGGRICRKCVNQKWKDKKKCALTNR